MARLVNIGSGRIGLAVVAPLAKQAGLSLTLTKGSEKVCLFTTPSQALS